MTCSASPCSSEAAARQPPESDLHHVYRLAPPEKFDELIPRLMDSLHVPGVSLVVIKNRKIAWQRHYGVRKAGGTDKVDTLTIFEACSLSKLPAAYLALQLVEAGQLELDKPLSEYLDEPYLADQPLHQRITARMVLLHTTGFPNWREGGWRSGGPLPVEFTPGTKFGYSGEGFLFLQRVMEHITDTPFEDLARRKLLDPLGMANGGYVWSPVMRDVAAAGHDDKGQVKENRRHFTRANAGYSLYCTAHDYAKFIVEILREDRSAPHSLTADTLESMLTPQQVATGREPVKRAGPLADPKTYRGLGWGIDITSTGNRTYHSGSNGTGFRCYCEFDPATGSGLVIMTNSYSGRQLWEQVVAACVPGSP